MLHSRLALAAAALIAITACNSPTAPNESVAATAPHGRLSGTVQIGPNCPVEKIENPCPTSPDAYRQRKILVYNEAKTSLLFTVDIDSQGAFLIDLVPGRYTVDLRRFSIDRTNELPTTVDIQANAVTTLNVNIDTGIR
jgi:hypothetical protein